MTPWNKFKKWLNQGLLGKTLAVLVALLALAIFVSLIIFLIIKAIPAFKDFRIFNTTDFELSGKDASIWMPLSITLLVSLLSILIATPIAIKTATFIKFRMSEKNSKRCFIIVQTLAGIPSVIFGLFALSSLGSVVKWIFHLESQYNIINAVIMLSFMILPTIISLTINTYDGIDKEQLLNPISLGLNKTSAIYKVVKKEAFGGIVIAVIVAIGRTIGETVALSMILTNSDSYEILKEGHTNILLQSLGTLGSLIASNIFSEAGTESTKAVLYFFGLFLLILIFLLNIFITYLVSKKNKNTKCLSKISRFEKQVAAIVLWIPHTISHWFYEVKNKVLGIDNLQNEVHDFIEKKIANDKFLNLRSYWWLFWEWFCAIISFGFISWIVFYVACKGLMVISSDQSTFFMYTKNTTGQAFLNTIIVVLMSLLFAIPIALLTTIYLVEYSNNEKLKRIAFFIVDSFTSAPSIIFGMFGLVVFVQTFGWTSAQYVGRSLIAGSLTLSIVILPTLIRMFEQAFSQVPQATRESGLALGLSKWRVITKIVIPAAWKSMVSSLILVTGKIMSETAPLFLTAGLSGSDHFSLLNPGQTLTTRIYAQTVSSNNLNDVNNSFESAFASLLLMLILIYIGYVIVPNWKNIKTHCYETYISYKRMYSHQIILDEMVIRKQIINKVLYISYSQMKAYDLDKKIDKKVILNNKIYKIKYLQDERIQKMMKTHSIFI